MSNVISGYRRTLEKHGESPLALQWTSYRAAAVRYRELVRDLSIDGKTILDAGCGMGDLLPYLYGQSANFRYLGMDINPDFVSIASKRYAGHEFEVGDPFNQGFYRQFDIVLSSGVMNHNEPNWLATRKAMITKLFSLASETLAFNMAGSFKHSAPATSKIAYARAEDILDFCSSLSTKVALRANYHPLDFTILMSKR